MRDFRAYPGHGLEAEVGGRKIYLGNEKFMAEHGVGAPPHIDEIRNLESQGKTVVLIADVEGLLGAIGVADTLKENSAEAVESLQRMGIEVYMMTGDNERTAQAMAAQAGIRHVMAGVMPDEKAAMVEQLRRGDKKVGMVGDGINDAPASGRCGRGVRDRHGDGHRHGGIGHHADAGRFDGRRGGNSPVEDRDA